MQHIEQLDQDRIGASLGRLGLRWFAGSSGRRVVPFSFQESNRCPLCVTIDAVGPVLVVQGWSQRRFRADDWPRILGLINTWHREQRWPRGYLHIVEDTEDSPLGMLIAEHQQPFGSGVNDEQLDETLNIIVQSSVDFLSEIAASLGYVPSVEVDAATIDSWLG